MNDRESPREPLPAPPRRWAVGPHSLASMRPLEAGEELGVVNEADTRLVIFAARADESPTIAFARRMEAERDRARHGCHAAVAELGATARRLGRLESLLRTLADRLDYLQGLWSSEAVMQRTIEQLRGVLAEIAAEDATDEDTTP